VATIMALGLALAEEQAGASVYESGGSLFL